MRHNVITLVLFMAVCLGSLATPAQSQQPTKAAPVSNKADGLELPLPQKVSTKQRAVTIQAQADNDVVWLVSGINPQAPISYMELGKLLVVFPNDVADTVSIVCATSKGNKPVLAVTVIEVVGPGTPPNPQPGPQPNPTPTAGPLYVTFITDATTDSPDLAALVNNPTLRADLKAQGCQVFALDVNSEAVQRANLAKAVQQAGGAPCLIIQVKQGNVGVVKLAQKLTDEASVRAAVQKLRGGN